MNVNNYLENGPELVVFAITYKCNFKCIHCPQPQLEYFPKDLDIDSVKRSLKEIKNLNWRPKKFQFHFFGESLINKNLPILIQLTKEYFPDIPTFLSTNGSFPMTGILDAGLDQLVISIDGSRKKTYEQRRVGGHFENVLRNTVDALRMKDRGQIIIQILKYETNDFYILKNKFKSLLRKNDIIWAKEIGSWAGKIEQFKYKETEWMGQHCRHIGRTLVLDGDGNTTVCCLDIDRKLSIGDFTNYKSLKDIWYSKRHKELIRSFIDNSHNKYQPCKTCYYVPEDPYEYYYIKEK